MVASLAVLFFAIVSVSFLATLLLTKAWTLIAHKIGLVGQDMHDNKKRKVAEAGGTELIAYGVAKTLKESGHKVVVVCKGNPEIKSFDGIETVRIPLRRQWLANFFIHSDDFKTG